MHPVALLLASLLIGDPRAASQESGYAVFDPSLAKTMLQQCSRSAPKPGEAGWTPGAADIARLEAALPAVLASAPALALHPRELEGAPTRWFRQYVGIVRGGRRYIYGNFVPNWSPGLGEDSGRRRPIIVCDGGVGFFGAEYDVEKGVFTHLAFNGYA